MTLIYLDNNATTRVDPTVSDLICKETKELFANPSSLHESGQKVREQLTLARRKIAERFSVAPNEVIFTSSATEAINTYLKGVFFPHFKGHLITSSLEHSAVYATCQFLQNLGVQVDYLKSSPTGCIDCDELVEKITDETKLIALMAVNNETGVKNPIEKIAEIAKERNIPLFIDGVAYVGKEPFPSLEGMTACTFSAHKFHGPKGSAILLAKNRMRFSPLLHGGHQEQGKRAGTENVIGALALSLALERSFHYMDTHRLQMQAYRDLLEKLVLDEIEEAFIVGTGERICNTSLLSFPGLDGESIVMNLDLKGVAASFGAACSSGAREPSRVVLHMNHSKAVAMGAVRFSLSRFTTKNEIEEASAIIIQIIKSLYSLTR